MDDTLMYRVELPNGDWAETETLEAALLRVEGLLEKAARDLREDLVVFRDGDFDSQATAMVQSAGMLV